MIEQSRGANNTLVTAPQDANTLKDIPDSRPEVDLAEVLKGRIAAGEPVYVIGCCQGAVADAVTATVQWAAAEAGKPAKVIQVMELPVLGSGD